MVLKSCSVISAYSKPLFALCKYSLVCAGFHGVRLVPMANAQCGQCAIALEFSQQKQ